MPCQSEKTFLKNISLQRFERVPLICISHQKSPPNIPKENYQFLPKKENFIGLFFQISFVRFLSIFQRKSSFQFSYKSWEFQKSHFSRISLEKFANIVPWSRSVAFRHLNYFKILSVTSETPQVNFRHLLLTKVTFETSSRHPASTVVIFSELEAPSRHPKSTSVISNHLNFSHLNQVKSSPSHLESP